MTKKIECSGGTEDNTGTERNDDSFYSDGYYDECEGDELPIPEEQLSVVSDDKDNVYIDDNDEHDDETGPDSDDDADQTVDTDEAYRPRHECKSISECVWQSKPLPRFLAPLHYVHCTVIKVKVE